MEPMHSNWSIVQDERGISARHLDLRTGNVFDCGVTDRPMGEVLAWVALISSESCWGFGMLTDQNGYSGYVAPAVSEAVPTFTYNVPLQVA